VYRRRRYIGFGPSIISSTSTPSDGQPNNLASTPLALHPLPTVCAQQNSVGYTNVHTHTHKLTRTTLTEDDRYMIMKGCESEANTEWNYICVLRLMEHNKGSPHTTVDIYSFRRHCGTLLYVCSYIYIYMCVCVYVYELIARAFSDSKCDGRERVRRYRVLYYQILLYV
jgi:hypothetical protein